MAILSIIIPAHNESATIEEVLRRVRLADTAGYEKEIVVVNDGSTDNTGFLIDQFTEKDDFRVIHHSENLGKGAAIQSAFRVMSGEVFVIQDADLEYNPEDIAKLLLALKPEIAGVFGRRGIKRYPERGFHYVIGAKVLTWTFNLLFKTSLSDLYSGYKLVRSKYIQGISFKFKGFEIEAELAATIVKKGGKIIETPIQYTPRNKIQGKHIRAIDAFKGFWAIIKLKGK